MRVLGGNFTPATTAAFILGITFWGYIAYILIRYVDIVAGAFIVIGLPLLAIVLCIRGVTVVATKQAIRTRTTYDPN